MDMIFIDDSDDAGADQLTGPPLPSGSTSAFRRPVSRHSRSNQVNQDIDIICLTDDIENYIILLAMVLRGL